MPTATDKAAAPAAAPPAPAAAGLFGAAPAAAAAADKTTAPAAAAAGTAPAAGPAGFGAAAPAAAAVPKAAGAAPAATVAENLVPSPPAQYVGRTVEEIINSLTDRLEKDAEMFAEEAQRVAEWDAVLRDSSLSLADLMDGVARLFAEGTELDRILGGVDAYQRETEKGLKDLEDKIDTLFSAQSHLIPDETDSERQHTYSSVLDVDSHLSALCSRLDRAGSDLDAAAERRQGWSVTGGGDPQEATVLGQIVRVLHTQ